MRLLTWLFGCWHKWHYFRGRPVRVGHLPAYRYRRRHCLKCGREEYQPIDLMAPDFRGDWTEDPNYHIAKPWEVEEAYRQQQEATRALLSE
jgi:hypothetical protein